MADASEEQTATPKGERIAFSYVQLVDVVISHRLKREIFDGTNQGPQFKTDLSSVVPRKRGRHRTLINP